MGQLSPQWALPPEAIRVGADPWVKRLGWIAAACAALMIVLFIIYKVVLSNGVVSSQRVEISLDAAGKSARATPMWRRDSSLPCRDSSRHAAFHVDV